MKPELIYMKFINKFWFSLMSVFSMWFSTEWSPIFGILRCSKTICAPSSTWDSFLFYFFLERNSFRLKRLIFKVKYLHRIKTLENRQEYSQEFLHSSREENIISMSAPLGQVVIFEWPFVLRLNSLPKFQFSCEGPSYNVKLKVCHLYNLH